VHKIIIGFLLRKILRMLSLALFVYKHVFTKMNLLHFVVSSI